MKRGRKKNGNRVTKTGDIRRETDRRVINKACCYLTLPKAREGERRSEKEEQLPTLVFLVKVVSLCVEGLLQGG